MFIIVTNADEYEKVGYRTGLWLGELSHFWDVLEAAGYQMDIASPLGGKIPIDPISLFKTELKDAVGLRAAVSKRYEDRAFMNLLHTTVKVSDVDSPAYDAIYMTGGHGVMFDYKDTSLLNEYTTHFDIANDRNSIQKHVHIRTCVSRLLLVAVYCTERLMRPASREQTSSSARVGEASG